MLCFQKARGLIFLLLVPVLLLACQLDYVLSRSGATPTATRVVARTPTGTRAQPTTPLAVPVIPTLAPLPTQPPAPLPQPQTIMATATGNLRIRSGPSTSNSQLSTLKEGESAQVVGRTPTADWLQIIIPSNPSQRGWISAEFAAVSGSLDGVPVVGGGGNPPVANPTLPPPRPGTYPYP